MKHLPQSTRRITLTLEARDFDDLLAAAKRRNLTLQELTERILNEALHSDLLPVILGEDDE
ncbi:MAG: hypothetical protein ACRDBL_09495 [Rhabdaerophilum sp.]